MPTILRKSLTACEQLPAPPPTPRKKTRPPFDLVRASKSAIRSMTFTSRPSIILFASSRWVLTNDMLSTFQSDRHQWESEQAMCGPACIQGPTAPRASNQRLSDDRGSYERLPCEEMPYVRNR